MKDGITILHRRSWLGELVSWGIVSLLALILWLYTNFQKAFLYDVVTTSFFLFMLYALISRFWITRAHRKAVRLAKRNEFPEAISNFQSSYDFFSKHSWLDRFRYVTLASSGLFSFREMALCNIAYCYFKEGNILQAKEFYRRALTEFPSSTAAAEGLNMLKSFETNKGDNSAALP